MTLPPTSSTTVPPTTSTVTLPPSTSTTTLPATTSTTTSSTTTTTFPATPCGKAKIAEPSQLPDQRTCTAASAAKPPAECNGWKTVGEVYDQALGELAESGKAQLYRWRSDTTTCFYLYRFYATGKTSNGVHCYNTSTCDVCAFDAQDVSRPEKWTDLNDLSRGATIQDCSLCHAAGPAKAECVAFATAMGCTPAETAVLCP